MGRIGVPCEIENIVLMSRSQQALDYLGKLFLNPGDTALVTWPTYMGALLAFNPYEPAYDRLALLGNRSASDFAEKAEAAGGEIKFAYMSSDFVNPTGETLTLAQRNRALDLGNELDVAIIEDGAYQELRYDGDAIPPIQALEMERCGSINEARTIYCGTFSKTLSPGLAGRLGVRAQRHCRQAGDDETGSRPAFGNHKPDGRSIRLHGPVSIPRLPGPMRSTVTAGTACWRLWRNTCLMA